MEKLISYVSKCGIERVNRILMVAFSVCVYVPVCWEGETSRQGSCESVSSVIKARCQLYL